MINLDKFNTQFDVNDIDPAQIVKLLTDNQKIVVIAIGIFTLLIAGVMFNDFHAKSAGLRLKMSHEQGKLDVIKAREKAINDLGSFKASIPKELTVFDLITLITNYARANNIDIVSYLPSPSKDMGLFDQIDVRFDVSTSDFKGMMLFIKKIESSKYPILINSWTGSEDKDGRISFKLAISAVLIHP